MTVKAEIATVLPELMVKGRYRFAPLTDKLFAPAPVMLKSWSIAGKALISVMVPVEVMLMAIVPQEVNALTS